ncbi:autophagy associated WD repeat protein Atg18c [Schizosaccharomyces pombe]|uniref:SVP1-like protein 2 n=1 Tax=Schizosaccharomyces pombe (strain 972 / ATCC 24843) TaxID=284812 RepID=HSV2_SCHPO|nr:WD repeat-containing protein Atg18c [Schizosaccharomyces pombe]Q9P3W2.1 RecName: Full=SVP1-like protein 2 [Schizosaccharomyces pombe 972h-]CAB93848.1 WD repeat protein involved in autophagy Atg18c [Schizosaccharomyces pombe]|eukprot:NP_594700.1 WD repeat-containing protein Atg18c [Schizosaccharomyces pombe]
MSTINTVSLNQDASCMSVALDTGYKIFQINPLKLRAQRQFNDGGLSIVKMLFRSNVLLLVGGGGNPKYAPNKLIVWDDVKERPVKELELNFEIKGICFDGKLLAIATASKLFLYQFGNNLKLQRCLDTQNPKGLCAMVTTVEKTAIVFPSRKVGQLQILFLFKDHMNTSIVPAHDSEISCLGISKTGSKIASSSTNGTLIRIWNSETGEKICEFRRGYQHTAVCQLAFSPDELLLACASKKETLHIFSLHGSPNTIRQLTSEEPYEEASEFKSSTTEPRQTHWKRKLLKLIDSGKRAHWRIQLYQSNPVLLHWLDEMTILICYKDAAYQKLKLTIEESSKSVEHANQHVCFHYDYTLEADGSLC